MSIRCISIGTLNLTHKQYFSVNVAKMLAQICAGNEQPGIARPIKLDGLPGDPLDFAKIDRGAVAQVDVARCIGGHGKDVVRRIGRSN
jgi:hypothetical protein